MTFMNVWYSYVVCNIRNSKIYNVKDETNGTASNIECLWPGSCGRAVGLAKWWINLDQIFKIDGGV
jgi:hypothetical protein